MGEEEKLKIRRRGLRRNILISFNSLVAESSMMGCEILINI